MPTPKVRTGGGLAAVLYTLRKGREAGGVWKLYKRMRSRNACKTCAVGMGGQSGGMVNETGHFPEVCKKSVQAQAADMAGAIAERFFAERSLSDLAALRSKDFEDLGRLAFPIIAEPGDTHYRRISWEDALARSAEAFGATRPDRTFFYASGRASNEAGFLLQLAARAYGTNNVNNCSYYCHQASGVALNMVYGSGTASVTLDDLDGADLALVAGANPASNHPRLITKLVELRERGGRVIVVNPLRELGLERFRVPSRVRSMLFGSQIADLYLQPNVGGDVALFVALLKGVMERGAVADEFVRSATAGFDDVKTAVESCDWDRLERVSGVPRDQIDAAADVLAASQSGVFMWAMGLTHHTNGVDNVLALANLALARGWLGREGSGLLPVRGHSNVQGIGSCGVTPALKKAFADRLEEIYRLELPTSRGLDTHACMVAAQHGEMDAAFLLGGNLYSSNPDSRWAAEALGNIPLTVTVSTKLNEGHVFGRGQTSIVLPALARDEEAQSTTQESMFNFVRLSDGGTPAVEGEMRSEVDIIAGLAQRLLPEGRFDWGRLVSHEALREEMAGVVPGYGKLGEIGKNRGEFQIDGRTFHVPSFSTEDGKAHFHATPVPDEPRAEGIYKMMTLRSEGQFNSVVYDTEDLYRGNRHRNVVMISADDASDLGVSEGDSVLVENETGSMIVEVSVIDIRSGNVAMYYPEANVLVPQRLDERSKTPAFKNVDVAIRPLRASAGAAAGS